MLSNEAANVKIGIMFDSQEGLDWDGWRRFAREIEASGFESLWSSDHLVSLVGRTERPRVDTWTALAVIARDTARLRFGTLVSPVTWRHPSILALTAAAVDALSGGRLEVGIGCGWNAYEHAMFGVKLPSMMVRAEMLDEAAQVLRLLWTGAPSSFAGRHFSLDAAVGQPAPTQSPHPPVIVGGGSERYTLPIAAKHSDDWNVYGLTVDAYRAKRAAFADACARVGRSPDTVARSLTMPIAIAHSDAELGATIDRIAAFFPLPLQFPPDLAPFTRDVLRERGWLAGSPADIVDQIGAYSGEGIHRVILHQLDTTDHAAPELIGTEVLPFVSDQ
jgi:alkanesulfonate monooxygenase SsuD/methylene tetrahydromethanopterin reductase-like flavin-dependent oxidoreductase (luciferase family)